MQIMEMKVRKLLYVNTSPLSFFKRVTFVFRYYMIQRAKDAQVVGIVVGTLGVGNVRATLVPISLQGIFPKLMWLVFLCANFLDSESDRGLGESKEKTLLLGIGRSSNSNKLLHLGQERVRKSPEFCALIPTLHGVEKWRLIFLRQMIGLKKSCTSFQPIRTRPRPITPCTRDFSRALSKLRVIAKDCDRFIALFAPVVIGWSNYIRKGLY
mgnify:CR=1 FL=1